MSIKTAPADPDDVSAVTDASGNYIILAVPPGAFTVNVINPAGVLQTSPASTRYAYTFSSGQNITGTTLEQRDLTLPWLF